MDGNARQKSQPGIAQAAVPLHAGRLLLRPVCDRDVDDVFAIYSDTHALEHFAREPLENREAAATMVAEDFAPGADKAAIVWAICLADRDRVIGTITLFHIDHRNRRAEIGYILNSQFWGQGYASEALARVIRFAFEVLGFGRLEADVDPQNAASLRLLERHGFKREGYFRKRWFIREGWYDSVMLGLVRPDLI